MNRFWKVSPWLVRLVLLPPTVIFALIASRYLLNPIQAASAVGIAFTSPLGITIARVGFAGFPLAEFGPEDLIIDEPADLLTLSELSSGAVGI